MPDLTDNEVRALLYFAVGVSGGPGDHGHELSFEGKVSADAVGQVKLSDGEYRIGTLRTNLSQEGGVVTAQLIDACREWAEADSDGMHAADEGRTAVLNRAQSAQAIRQLSRTPEELDADNGCDLDPDYKAYLNRFLASKEGQAFVHGLDVSRVERLMEDVVAPLRSSQLFRDAGAVEQARLITLIANACGKNEMLAETLPRDICNGSLRSREDVVGEIFRVEPTILSSDLSAQDGAMVFHALRCATADHSLYEPWQKIVANPLVNHHFAGSDAASPYMTQQYQLIRDVFADPVRRKIMLSALDQHSSHVDGFPSLALERGYCVEGRNFLTWDHTKGRAFVNGRWQDFARVGISQVINANCTVDLYLRREGRDDVLFHISRPIFLRGRPHDMPVLEEGEHVQREGTLRENDRSVYVHTLQSQLVNLGYHAAAGGSLRKDGMFGPSTRAVLEAFQQDRRLKVDGIAGRDTFVAIHRAFQERAARPLADVSHPGNYMYNRALMVLQKSNDWRESEEPTDRLAAAAAIAARGAGFTTIDRVAFDASRTTIYLEQDDHDLPMRGCVQVDVRRALLKPAAERAVDWYRAERDRPLAAAADEQAVQPRLPRMR